MNRVVTALLEKGYVTQGYLGVGLYSVPRPSRAPTDKPARQRPLESPCLLVLSVEPNGPADAAGVLVGDLIVALDGTAVGDTDDVQQLLGPERVGKSVTASVIRGGQPTEVAIVVKERPR